MKPFLVLAARLALLGGSTAGAGAAIPVVDTATYRADLRVAGTALVKLGTTLERNDAGPALRRRAPALRRLLFSFDRRMYAMSRYRLEDAEVNGHRARVSRAGLAVSGPMSSFLDAALLDRQARLERRARTVLARLGGWPGRSRRDAAMSPWLLVLLIGLAAGPGACDRGEAAAAIGAGR